MKSPITLLITALLGCAATVSAQTSDPLLAPIGELDASQQYVRTGSKTQLDWTISYPATIPDILINSSTGTVTTREDLHVTVRIGGSEFGPDNNSALISWIHVGGTPTELYFGSGQDITPNAIVFDQVVPANTTIDVTGQGFEDGTWNDYRTTQAEDPRVFNLTSEEAAPSYATALNLDLIESYLTPYFGIPNNGHGNNTDSVDSSNPGASTGTAGSVESDPTVDDESKVVAKMGPTEMIYLFELGNNATDYQDLLVVISYEQITP